MHISLTAIPLIDRMPTGVLQFTRMEGEAAADSFPCRLLEFMAAGFGSISAVNVIAPTYAARR